MLEAAITEQLAQKALVLVGPTAIGKSSVAMALAQAVDGVILSADSQLVYQGLNLGTAKPTQANQASVPHYLMDLVPPTESFTAANYKEAALPLLENFRKAKKPVIVVGGTGFYLQQVFEQKRLPAIPPNPDLREHLLSLAEEQVQQKQAPSVNEALHKKLEQLDPVRAEALHPNNQPRVLRALEIIEVTGKPVPTLEALRTQAEADTDLKTPDACWVGLRPANRQWLWRRIEQRIDAMVTDGWLEETQELMKQYGETAHALQIAHGYPEMLKVLKGDIELEEAKADIAIQVRQYSRRQWTWFSKRSQIQWLEVNETSQTEQLAEQTLAIWQESIAEKP